MNWKLFQQYQYQTKYAKAKINNRHKIDNRKYRLPEIKAHYLTEIIDEDGHY